MSSEGKRPLGFVNRRGHNQGDVSASELSELSIDEQPVSNQETFDVQSEKKTSPADRSDKKTRPAKPVRRARHIRWSRRKTLICILVLLVLVGIPVLIGELLRSQYHASVQSAQRDMESIAAESLTLQKKDSYSAKDMTLLNEKVEKVRDGMCPGAFLDNVALLYPRAKTAHETCIAERTKIATLATAQRDMTTILAYIENVNALFERTATPASDAFAVVATQQSNWQSLQDELKKVNAPNQLKAAHDQLTASAVSITDGWSKLNIASNEQNADNFRSAEEQLNKGYEAVRASKSAFAEVVENKQSDISSAAQNI